MLARDLQVISTAPQLFVPDQQIGDLNGGDNLPMALGLFGKMVVSHRLNQQLGHAVALHVESSQFRVVNAQHTVFDFNQLLPGQEGLTVNLSEMIGKCPGHYNFAHIVDQPGDIVRIVGGGVRESGDFVGQQTGADAVLPEFTPRERTLQG